MPPPVPEKIGRYDIISVLGRGGMGVLYKARDPVLERDVALKMMLIDFSFDQTARERFEREAKAVARLQHSNVVTIHELGQNDGAPYIVMELLSGQDLEHLMKRPEPLPIAQKLEIVAQLCDGLAYAHEQGIVHRDIKPGNVRVLEDGSVKILDFGIAKFAQSSMTQSGTIMGTASYMAPEQILGNPVDGRADLFSVGVLLHELLSGEKPFAGDSPTAVVYQIVHVEPQPMAARMPGLPEELNQIVAKALKKDPNERYARASEMASDLRLVKMILDLPLTTAAPTASAAAAVSLGRLHATGEITRSTGATTRLGGITPPTGEAPGAATGGAQPAGTATAAVAPPKSKTGLFIGIGAAVVVLAGAGYFVMNANKAAGPESSPTPSPAAAKAPAATAAPAAPGTAKTTDSMSITSVPPGARILMNGADTGRVTPATVSLGGKDPATLQLSLKGHQTLTATLTAADLKRGKKEFQLAREAQPVHLTASGAYPFEIRQGDAVVSPAARQHDVTIQPGGGSLTAFNADYMLNEPIAIDFQKPDADITIRAAGTLAVFAANETCSIVVDGHEVGFPPLPRKPIAAGSHTVVLKCKDGKEDSRKITVTSGDLSTVTFRSPQPQSQSR